VPVEYEDYLAVRTGMINVNTVLSFDLYQDINGQLRLFRDKSIPLSPNDLTNLSERGAEFLYIPAEQKDQIFEHLRQKLPLILKDASVPVEEKLDVLSKTSANILGKVLDNPMSVENIKEVVSQCDHHVATVLLGEEARTKMAENRPRAPYPIAHAISVGNLSMLLGLKCGMEDADELHELGVGALLHEIGKTMINRDYYYQPGYGFKITDPSMQKYPRLGASMLQQGKVVPEGALIPIEQHQERLDGTGFPGHLKEQQIGFTSRIVAICDRYDESVALSNNGRTLTPFAALKAMKDQPEKFDQKILFEFVRLLGTQTDN